MTEKQSLEEMTERKLKGDLKTQSGYEVKEVYGPEDVADLDFKEHIGQPGGFPFTRGAYPRMYRDKLWVRGVPPGSIVYAETQGRSWEDDAAELFEKGLITSGVRSGGDYHMLATVDPDHPLVKYDMAGCGRGSSFALWQVFHGRKGPYTRDLIKRSVTSSLVLELGHAVGPADVCEYTMFLAAMEAMGMDPRQLRGNMVNDPLHVHITGAMNYKQPLKVGLRVSLDGMEYCVRHTPQFRPTNGGCAYNLREVGINTIQELAFRFGNYIAYADALLKRGVSFEEFGPRPAIALSGEIDFFETICKLRAARQMWAKIAKDRYGADPTKLRCPPCNTNLAGSAMTAQQPIFNVIRNTIAAMASVLGGVNGMEMKGYTEVLTAPPPEAWAVNKATEAIIAEEANIPLVADPLGGSYYVEWLTHRIYQDAMALLQKILDMGGMVAAIESGWVRGEVERAAFERQKELEERRKIKVGVNAYQSLNDYPIALPMLKYQRASPDQPFTKIQQMEMAEFKAFREARNLERAKAALRNLFQVARTEDNLIRAMIEAWKADASIGEVMGVVRLAMGFSYDQFEMVPPPAYMNFA